MNRSNPLASETALEATVPTMTSQPGSAEQVLYPSLQQALGVYITVHGHFYQPPRENPYLNAIERQPSAEPYHDWNERIYYECYRPNAFARILDHQGDILEIINNFEYLSFNIGPTLMNWLERYDLEVYQRILEADRRSCERLNGHGNAIAQVYNHIILPLANQRDKLTQIRWGKADFRSRFGREPEGMWLAEAAVDHPTLEVLVTEAIRFIILAPSQVQRCRPLPSPENPSPEWQEVGGGQVDPTRPYRCFLPGGDPEQDFIDIFLYDGPISRDLGFGDVLNSSNHLAGRLGQAVRGDHNPSQLIAIATDGETFGHHKGGTEKTLAYALTEEFPRRGWTVTNFAHYLSLSPPTWEVELKPVTAWSCSHGVDRWQDHCGCGDQGGVWHQRWRRPLRNALDWLRDQLAQVYEQAGEKLFQDPWQARDQYVQLLRGRGTFSQSGQRQNPVSHFLAHHQAHPLTPGEQVDALRLLEMQHHALLMYTSCGWFFEELSRPEGTQILRYASRALELAGDVVGIQLEPEFIQRLSQAPSNLECFEDGGEVYRQQVIPAQVSLNQVAAHYAISSLFTPYPQQQPIYCYQAEQLDYQLQRMGCLSLAVGHLQLTSQITQESVELMFAVLHLGGWDFHCCLQPFGGRRQYSEMKASLFGTLQEASAAKTVLAMTESFGDEFYGLDDLFAEERYRILELLSQETLTRLDQLYTQVYRDNYGILMAFRRDHLPVPQELQVAAAVSLSHRALSSLQGLESELSDFAHLDAQGGPGYLAELEAIAAEAEQLGCQLNLVQAQETLERLVLKLLWELLQGFDPDLIELQVQIVTRLIQLGQHLDLNLFLAPAQELYLQCFQARIQPTLQQWQTSISEQPLPSNLLNQPELAPAQLRQLLRLGQTLAIAVDPWFE